MIWDVLLTFTLILVNLVAGLFPDANIDTINTIQSSIDPVRNMITSITFVFPVDVFFTALGIIFTTELFMLGFRVLMYVLHFISLKNIPRL